ncbi:MAG TPA: hypothetical protein VFY89_07925 [Ktedonobacterales bacterium]
MNKRFMTISALAVVVLALAGAAYVTVPHIFSNHVKYGPGITPTGGDLPAGGALAGTIFAQMQFQ